MDEDSVPSHGARLAAQLTQATTELLAVAEACTAAQWRTRCANEERSVGVLVHHVASIDDQIRDLIGLVVAGRPAPPLTREMIDHANARHAAAYANATQDETCTLLRRNSAAVCAAIGALADADLDCTTVIPLFGAQAVTAQQLVEFLLIGHTLGHLASIQAALLAA